MDETEKKIKEILSQKLEIPSHYTNTIKTALNNKYSFNFLKIAAVICICITVTGGIAFATKDYIKDFLKNSFGIGKEIDTAVEYGYIEKTDMEYIASDATIDGEQYVINTRITDFLMDDINLSVHFDFEFADTLSEVINIENLSNIELIDLIVTDENNKIIFNNNKEAFEKFCTKNNLSYKFGEFNENYMNNGLNNFINYKNGNQISFTYNMYTEGEYPKSKKLYFYFTQIELKESKNNDSEQNKIILEGNWNISVDVPEQMYNRKTIPYRVISCSNSNFDITTATLYDTRFEFGAVISNMERPDDNKILYLETLTGNETEDEVKEYNDKVLGLLEEWYPIKKAYIENEKGQKFEVTDSLTGRGNSNFVENNKFDYYTTFELTKYEATDKLKVIILLKDTVVTVELQKT